MDWQAVESVRAAATAFRSAIERCDSRALPIGFTHFPLGSCGDVTLVLGAYLTDQGFGVFDYVSGERTNYARNPPRWHSQGRVIVDITADQFPEMPEPIIVCTSSRWHDTFTEGARRPGDYRLYDKNTQATLGAAYRMICDRL